ARAVRVCRMLVRGAAAHAMDAATFGSELDLLEIGPHVIDMLRSGYDAGRALLREEGVRAAMVEHGRVLEGVAWRLERVLASSEEVSFAVALLTLRCRGRDGEEHFSFQATPERLRELHDVCDRLLGPRRAAPR